MRPPGGLAWRERVNARHARINHRDAFARSTCLDHEMLRFASPFNAPAHRHAPGHLRHGRREGDNGARGRSN